MVGQAYYLLEPIEGCVSRTYGIVCGSITLQIRLHEVIERVCRHRRRRRRVLSAPYLQLES